jgi:hypothetical protein
MLIHKELRSTIGDDDTSAPTQLAWTDTNPLAVTVNVHDGTEWVEWVFAFELLAEGLSVGFGEHAGWGDVRTWSADDGVTADGVTFVIRFGYAQDAVEVSMDWDTVSWFVAKVVTEVSAEEMSAAVDLQIDTFLHTLNIESF